MRDFSDSESCESEDEINYKAKTNNKEHVEKRTRLKYSIEKSRGFDYNADIYNTEKLISSTKSDNSLIGPELPLCSNKVQNVDSKTCQDPSTNMQYDPAFPSSSINMSTESDSNKLKNDRKQIGPELPPHLKERKLSELETSYNLTTATALSEGKPELYGPALPPHLINSRKNDGSGSKLIDSFNNTSQRNKRVQSTESSDDECYGPLPVNVASHSKAHIALEERALQIKIDSLQENLKDQVTREEWMIELPQVHSRNLGLGPRQFRAKPAPDLSDRSSWTDTPQDKAKKGQDKQVKKIDLKREAEVKEQKKYDHEQEKMIKKYKKHKKEESLLDIHQRNLSEKKKEEGSTRRPFNREVDLKVNRFDDAQKKSILKKAQFLDDRFSSGHSKFL